MSTLAPNASVSRPVVTWDRSFLLPPGRQLISKSIRLTHCRFRPAVTRRPIRCPSMRQIVLASLLLTASDSYAKQALIFEDTFGEGLAQWEVLDPETWRVADGGGAVEITGRASDYRPPHRSPGHVALVRDLDVGSCIISFRVKSTLDTGAHRDCCVFFGWQDSANFYYVHLGARPDPASGQIMVVDDAPRRPLTNNQREVPWDNAWHTVRVERNVASGKIRVFFDDELLMEANDTTYGAGRVGIGSFDDLNRFDDFRVAPLGDRHRFPQASLVEEEAARCASQ